MRVLEISVVPNTGGLSEKLTLPGGSDVDSSVINANAESYINFYPTVDCFIRMGVAPTAVVDADQFIPAGNMVRIGPFPPGYKLSVYSATAGIARITKES